MDQRERQNDLLEAIRTAIEGFQAGVWTAIPCIIQSFDATKLTCTCLATVKVRVVDSLGNYSWISIPLLTDVPVVYPAGGGFSLTFPVAKGDEALVVFSSQCIDQWWQAGGLNNLQPEIRRNDLSDGFALVGVRSQTRLLSGYSTGTVQLRSDDGQCYIEIAQGHVANVIAPGGINLTSAHGNINLSAPAGNVVTTALQANTTATVSATLTAPTFNVIGNLALNGGFTQTGGSGNITMTLPINSSAGATFAGHTVGSHTHAVTGVQTGGSTVTSNPPTG